MSSFSHSFHTSSPILTIPPQPAHQTTLGMATYGHQSANFSDAVNQDPQTTSWGTQPSLARPAAGRKRSRDEASVNLNDDHLPLPTPIEPIKESEEDWIYGEGMVLIKPSTRYIADASSQSGTWVEEKAAEEEARRAEAALQQQQLQRDRPSLRSYKSQRLEQPHAHTSRTGQDCAIDNASPAFAIDESPAIVPTLAGDTASQPVIDDFTLHLGIGWRRISDDEHIQAAARGWARYIENHYPISMVSIRLESKGLQSYLVEASDGYFLFAEDLKHGRLVSRTANGALANLKCSPPVFDGSETLIAAESPKPFESPSPPIDVPNHPDVEMDMS